MPFLSRDLSLNSLVLLPVNIPGSPAAAVLFVNFLRALFFFICLL